MPSINATKRETMGRKNYLLRNEGKIPAVIYGAVEAPLNITLDRNEFIKTFRQAGESTVVAISVEGTEYNVLIQDYQLDPVRDDVIHADFRAIDMNQEIEAEVKLEFTGEALAVKGLGGTLVRAIEAVGVKALPKDLVTSIEVDLTKLETFDDVIRVADLELPNGVAVTEDPERTIAVVTPPRSEEEMAALDEEVSEDVGAVEVEGEKKEEESTEEDKKEA